MSAWHDAVSPRAVSRVKWARGPHLLEGKYVEDGAAEEDLEQNVLWCSVEAAGHAHRMTDAAETPGPHVTGVYRTDLIQRGVKWPGLPYKGMMRSSNN